MTKDNKTPQNLDTPLSDQAKIEAAIFEVPGQQDEAPKFEFTFVHGLLVIFALFISAFIAFITFSKSIQITTVAKNLSKPTDFLLQSSDQKINSFLKLPLGNRVLVLPGDHEVQLSAPGFEDLKQTVTVSGERHQQFEIVMKRLPGQLSVQVPEGAVATVSSGGNVLGQAPGTISALPAGYLEVTVDAELYRPITQRVLIRGKNQTETLVADLQPAWSDYTFDSLPQGASVYVDGEAKGLTPLEIKIEEGTRAIEIKAEKYKTFTQEVAVVANEVIVAPVVELIPADGVLEVSSTPPNAAVIVNQEFVGTSPMTLELEPDTEHTVQVYKAGYQLHDQSFNLAPAQTQTHEVGLNADLVSVQVSISPSDAELYVNGQSRGKGSRTISLNSLPHKISVRKNGYVTQSTEIVPTKRSKQLLSFSLLTEEQHYWAQLPDQYTNRAGHSMKLFKNLGTVQMGSSRREDGRRANEAVYTAQLSKPFYVALHETTNKQFRRFKATHNAGNYKGKSLDANRAPALNVSWQQAAQYCNWLSKQEGLDPFYQTISGFVSGMNPDANGYRLLTEVEWSWLARNTNDGVLTYPWGASKSAPSGKKVENLADKKAAEIITFTLADYDDGYVGPAPVGRFPANHRGLYDMGGNAAEWVNDWYSSKGNSEVSGSIRDPLGPDNGEFHVVRGASWARGHLPQLRLAYRDYGAKGAHDIGFRIARYAGLNKSKRQVAKN